jgi:hypothetical protein
MTPNSGMKRVNEEEFFTEPSYVSTLSQDELIDHIAQTRAKLSGSLDQLEEKADVPKQLKKAQTRMKKKFVQLKNDQPLLLGAIGLGAAVVATAIIVAVARSGRK